MTDHKRQGEIQMGITSDGIREIFKGLENGDGAAFFEHVADNVDWIVEGTHPLAGHYRSKKAFREGMLEPYDADGSRACVLFCFIPLPSFDFSIRGGRIFTCP
jgi:hypothetical protein